MQSYSYAVCHEAQTDKASVGEEEVISPHIALAGFTGGFLHHWRLGLFEPDPPGVAY